MEVVMIQSEFEVKNEFGTVVYKTEEKKKAEDKVNENPDLKLRVEEVKYYQEIKPVPQEKTFMESMA
jgi:hypothetical protein